MTVKLTAPAKLTTSLSVVGRREDGYHLIDAVMVTLDLADTLQVTEGEEGCELRDEVGWIGLPGTAPVAGDGLSPVRAGENLVERALALCGVRARWLLEKRIPSGAGLGGGSADAAAILRWQGVTDRGAAARLGADVPFCLVGGAARVRGIGELVEPVAETPTGSVLLVTPRLHVSTPVVYAAFDELAAPAGKGPDESARAAGNDLEPAALLAYPGLRWWRDLLGAATGLRPRLAGSGGTWFVEGERGWLADLAGQIRGEVVVSRESAMVTVADMTMRTP